MLPDFLKFPFFLNLQQKKKLIGMNNKILVIEDSKSKISEEYECPKLEYVNQSKDENIHLWLIKLGSIYSQL